MIEDIISRVSPKTLIVAVVAVVAIIKLTTWLSNERKIRALGGHAKKVNTKFPFGTLISPSTSTLF